MKSVEDLARILGDIIDQDYFLGVSSWNAEQPRFIGLDGTLDLFRIIEELQAAGIIAKDYK